MILSNTVDGFNTARLDYVMLDLQQEACVIEK